jgi:anthranilate synthase component 2
MFLMIDNYDSFTYNLVALFRSCGAGIDIIKNDEFVSADSYEAIIISPGPSTPKSSGTTLEYLSLYTGKKPIFGVCLGMQSIAYSLGFEVVHAPTVKHGKIDRIKVCGESILFAGIPNEFNSVRYHSLSVNIDEKYITSRSAGDGAVMSVEIPEKKLFGVQFHPESIMSEHGEKIAANFIKYARSE